MKRPLIGVTCNYDYRDTVGIYIGKSRSNPGTDPGL